MQPVFSWRTTTHHTRARPEQELLETEALALRLVKKQRLLRADVIQYHSKLEKAIKRDKEYLEVDTWVPTIEEWLHLSQESPSSEPKGRPAAKPGRRTMHKEMLLLSQEQRVATLQVYHKNASLLSVCFTGCFCLVFSMSSDLVFVSIYMYIYIYIYIYIHVHYI
jgi:hypothetical protein